MTEADKIEADKIEADKINGSDDNNSSAEEDNETTEISDFDTMLNNINNNSAGIIHGDLKNESKIQADNMDFISKEDFSNHLQSKLDKLGDRLKILQIKYQTYKSWYDKMNIMIIIISSMLSIFEAFRNEMNDVIEGDKISETIFSMIPIGISSFITCSAAIIKFKKYQEKMENMQFTREKVLLSISKIKHIQELIKFRKEEKLDKIKKKYIDDIYGFYNESTSEIERHIKYKDHYKFNITKYEYSRNLYKLEKKREKEIEKEKAEKQKKKQKHQQEQQVETGEKDKVDKLIPDESI